MRVLAAAGCQSAGSRAGSPSAAAAPGNAVMCDKCMRTWVRSPVYDKGRVVSYRNRTQKATCPDCEKAAADYFATGKLSDCKMCGEDLHIAKPQQM